MPVSSRKTARRKATPASWKPGQSGNPKGRPKREVEREYLDAVLGECSMEDWRRIVRRAVRDAVAGDRHARQFVADYMAPVPDRHEITAELAGDPLPDLNDADKRAIVRMLRRKARQEQGDGVRD